MQKKRSILLLGKQGGILNWYEHVRAALVDMPSVEANSFALNHEGGADRLLKGVIKLVGRDGLEQYKARQLARLLRRTGAPDLVLITDLIALSTPVQEVLQSLVGKTQVVRWIGDRFNTLDRTEQAVVRHYCFTDTALAGEASKQGFPSVSYLPLAYNPRIFHEGRPWSERSPELVFIGGYSNNRTQLIQSLVTPIALRGKRWRQEDFPRHSVTPTNLSIEQVAECYSHTRCVLNVINSDNVANGLNMRAFEAAGAGCLLFNDPVADLPALFEVGKEVLIYHSPEELNELYSRSQREPKWACRVASNGFMRASQCHRYQDRLDQLLREVGA